MMRNHARPLLLVAFALVLVACGSDKKASRSPAEGEGEEGEGEEGEGEEPCPDEYPDRAKAAFQTDDCINIWFDYYPAPQDGLRPVVVLLHEGLSDTRRDWERKVPGLVETLQCAGYWVFLADLRGHLESKQKVCVGAPGETCEAPERCQSGVCDEGHCGQPAACDPMAEEPTCTEGLECNMWGLCVQAVEPLRRHVDPRDFEPEDWYRVADDVAAVIDALDGLARKTVEFESGAAGHTTDKPGEFVIPDGGLLDSAVENSELDRNDIPVEIGVFLRIPVDGETKDYSIRKTVVPNPDAPEEERVTQMTLRSNNPGDWPGGEDGEGFYETEPLDLDLEDVPWEIRLKRNLPFDPERVAIMGAGLGADGALRYAARPDSKAAGTILLSPRIDSSDELSRRDFRDLAGAVTQGSVLALAGSEDPMGSKAVGEMAKVENERIETNLVGGSLARGIPLAAEPGVLREIKNWMRDRI